MPPRSWARATGPFHTSAVRVGRHEVAITNPDKVFFPEPGLTKGDLVAYYLAVAPCALHHIRRRPFHMKRYPNGVEGDFFHQKRVPPHPDFVGEQFVQFPSGHSTVFAVVDNAAALAWVVNLGCIELHTWHSRVDDIERPDYLLIDLDPSEGNPWEYVREIALVVKEVMDELGLASFPKTSGATGLHILAPIRPELRLPGGEAVRQGAGAGGRAQDRRPGRRHDDLEGGRPPRASSWTSARTPATGRSPRPTRSGRRRTRGLRRRWPGRRFRAPIRPGSPCRRCPGGSARWET